MENKELFDAVDKLQDELEKINAKIWSTPELGLNEFESIKPLIAKLSEEGFTIEEGVAGMDTAFVATWGNEGPVIGLLAEYDALPSLSQKAACTTKEEVEPNGNGHGCGHCSIGVGSLGGAIAIKEYLEKTNTKGTIKFFGCPGEECGSGKVFMTRAGLFDNVDVCLAWHPNDFNSVMSFSTLAIRCFEYHFNGIASHAASGPDLGRSALDACELMNVGVNYLREHMIDEARIHYAYINAGGKAPNVVQDYASLKYNIRSPKIDQVNELQKRVHDIARGAALMTDTTLTIKELDGMCDTVAIRPLDELVHNCLVEVGAPQYDEADYALAQKFRAGMPKENLTGNYWRMRKYLGIETPEQAEELSKDGLPDFYMPYKYMPDYILAGSTDIGDVSYVTPTSTFMLASWAIGTLAHSWESTAMSNCGINTKAMVCAAKAFALTATKLYENEDLLVKIKEEHKKRVPNGYTCPIPDSISPKDLV